MNNFNTFDSRNAVPENEKIIMMHEWQLRKLMKETVSETLSCTNLDNSTADTPMSEQENDMAKRIKTRIVINGETHWVTGESQQEVIMTAAQLLAESMPSQAAPQQEKPLFSTCAWRWYNVYKLPKVKDNTAYNYKVDMENHILPVFGDKRIDQIKHSDIQLFLNTKRNKAASTVKHLWLILHGIFSVAKWDGYIESDPTEDIRQYTLSRKKKKREALSTDEIADIIAQLPKLKGRDLLLMALLIYTGCRRSEILALRWEDIDFKKKLIHVQRSATFQNNQPQLGPTKSEAGVRFIPLSADLEALLAPHRMLSGFIIGQETPITEMTYKRMWERIGKTINLHGATAHVFRHTYITMAAPHLDIKTLQTIAGHADISTTLNRYTHGREDKIIAAGEALKTMYA